MASKSGDKPTPMLEQYLKVREEYKGYVLFYRLGDFYEMFYEDAEKISKELELTLTSRAGVPMCGVPYHSVETYLKRLIEKGFKVAICEQKEDPALAKGLVERGVVRLVTPGTLYEDSMLDESRNNFIACFYFRDNSCGMVFADISTGEFHTVEKSEDNVEHIQQDIIDELSRYSPSEVLFNDLFVDLKRVHAFAQTQMDRVTYELFEEYMFEENGTDNAALCKQYFGDVFGTDALSEQPLARKAVFAVFRYINETQKDSIPRSVNLMVHTRDEFMDLGVTARRNLELTETIRGRDKKGTLISVLDRTRTSMGRRKLGRFLEQPLLDPARILERLDAVGYFLDNYVLLEELREILSGVYDLERLISRVVYRAANPKDLNALGCACGKLPELKELIKDIPVKLIKRLDADIDRLEDISTLISNAVSDDPPALTKDGGYIRDGFNAELDRLRSIAKGGTDVLSEIEAREKERTGIKNLRVGYNRVFGYYIEVSKGNIPLVPADYVRKQTLTNGERYITDELKNIENEILGAKDKALALEAEIFSELRDFISERIVSVQRTAEAIAYLDVLQSFAFTSRENNYVRPDISLEGVIDIKDGRHPVVEKVLSDAVFTPNDAFLDAKNNRFLIITGPNMAGKSTFMRQVAIITVMAQIGCFVPARSARIGVVDRIFTRVGASDDLASGQSTFMVEMTEVAEILKNSTSKSLVILDEIGRGTSTFDGMSIAKAVAEYINGKIGCKTLFATHYHELTALSETCPGICNYSVAVMKKGDDIKFLHKIVEGGTDNSYGIEVAKLAGIPQKVIDAAKKALKEIELGSKIELEKRLDEREQESELDFSAIAKNNVIQSIKNLDLDNLTPREAYSLLEEFKKELS